LLGGKKVHPRRQNPGYAYVTNRACATSKSCAIMQYHSVLWPGCILCTVLTK